MYCLLKLFNIQHVKDFTVLDCYLGTGTTGMACALEPNVKFIGIEMGEEYIEIAKARTEWTKKNRREIMGTAEDGKVDLSKVEGEASSGQTYLL